MKDHEIQVGDEYEAEVSGETVRVRVLHEGLTVKGSTERPYWDCRVLDAGGKVRIRAASKFLRKVAEDGPEREVQGE
jgi:hypothetical protein